MSVVSLLSVTLVKIEIPKGRTSINDELPVGNLIALM